MGQTPLPSRFLEGPHPNVAPFATFRMGFCPLLVNPRNQRRHFARILLEDRAKRLPQ